jgi:pimeloyl-ACP methyl ester carboxylesterase
MTQQIIYLPGASGNPDYWKSVSNNMVSPGEKVHLGWPGFDHVPADPRFQGISDLITMVTALIDKPTVLIAQSMGGIIALGAALQKLSLVTHIVLTATSAGIDLDNTVSDDWRPPFLLANPTLPTWFTDYHDDIKPQLAAMMMPTLLMWGDADAISPVQIAYIMQQILPNSTLKVITDGDHDIALTHPHQLAADIDAFLLNSR